MCGTEVSVLLPMETEGADPEADPETDPAARDDALSKEHREEPQRA